MTLQQLNKKIINIIINRYHDKEGEIKFFLKKNNDMFVIERNNFQDFFLFFVRLTIF